VIAERQLIGVSFDHPSNSSRIFPSTSKSFLPAHDSADGRIEVLVRGADNRLWHLWQVARDGDWSNWEDLGKHHPLPNGNLYGREGSWYLRADCL
jgi:hypothetical protein